MAAAVDNNLWLKITAYSIYKAVKCMSCVARYVDTVVRDVCTMQGMWVQFLLKLDFVIFIEHVFAST